MFPLPIGEFIKAIHVAIRVSGDCKHLYEKLLRVLRDISCIKGLIKTDLDDLLNEVGGINIPGRQELVSELLTSLEWKSDEVLLEEMKKSWGDSYECIVGIITSISEQLQEIERLGLEKYGQGFLVRPQEGNHSRGNSQPLSWDEKLKIVRKNIVPKLSSCHDELDRYEKNLRGARDNVQRRNLTFTPSQRPLSRRPLTDRSRKALSDLREIQKQANTLHRIVSKSLGCQCHPLHLRIERPHENRQTNTGVYKTSSEAFWSLAAMQFSFLVAVDSENGLHLEGSSNSAINAAKNPFQVTFTSGDLDAIGPSQHLQIPDTTTTERSLCEKLKESDENYETYIPGDSNDNRGFLLKRTCLPTGSLDDSPFLPADVSLHDLVRSYADTIKEADQVRIAANLARSVLPFFSSPWVKDWSSQKVLFFKKYDRETTLWTPHVSISFSSDGQSQLEDRNKEIYALGWMLLELGRLEAIDCWSSNEYDIFSDKMGDLVAKLGVAYKTVVKNCLNWGQTRGNFLTEESLDKFLKDVRSLEECFSF